MQVDLFEVHGLPQLPALVQDFLLLAELIRLLFHFLLEPPSDPLQLPLLDGPDPLLGLRHGLFAFLLHLLNTLDPLDHPAAILLEQPPFSVLELLFELGEFPLASLDGEFDPLLYGGPMGREVGGPILLMLFHIYIRRRMEGVEYESTIIEERKPR